jgi:hypothetical protein
MARGACAKFDDASALARRRACIRRIVKMKIANQIDVKKKETK